MESVERSFADLEYESKKHKTRREHFLGLTYLTQLLERAMPAG